MPIDRLWDRLTGKRAQLEKQNQLEAMWSLRRDQDQRQMMINAQLGERRELQLEIKATRSNHAMELQRLHFDVTNYRLMKRGEAPKPKAAFDRLEALSNKKPAKSQRPSFEQLTEKKTDAAKKWTSSEERLKRLREQQQMPPRGPELDH